MNKDARSVSGSHVPVSTSDEKAPRRPNADEECTREGLMIRIDREITVNAAVSASAECFVASDTPAVRLR